MIPLKKPRPELTDKGVFKHYMFKPFKYMFYLTSLSFSFGEKRNYQPTKKKGPKKKKNYCCESSGWAKTKIRLQPHRNASLHLQDF